MNKENFLNLVKDVTNSERSNIYLLSSTRIQNLSDEEVEQLHSIGDVSKIQAIVRVLASSSYNNLSIEQQQIIYNAIIAANEAQQINNMLRVLTFLETPKNDFSLPIEALILIATAEECYQSDSAKDIVINLTISHIGEFVMPVIKLACSTVSKEEADELYFKICEIQQKYYSKSAPNAYRKLLDSYGEIEEIERPFFDAYLECPNAVEKRLKRNDIPFEINSEAKIKFKRRKTKVMLSETTGN